MTGLNDIERQEVEDTEADMALADLWRETGTLKYRHFPGTFLSAWAVLDENGDPLRWYGLREAAERACALSVALARSMDTDIVLALRPDREEAAHPAL